MTEKRLLKISSKYTLIGLAISLFFWFVVFDLGICHAQTQTGYRVPARVDIGGGRMTGDMWMQAGTNGVRLYIGTQSVTQVGTTGVINGTIAAGLPYVHFPNTGGSVSANFVGFTQVAVSGGVIPSAGSMTGKLDAVDGVGTNNTFNNPTLAGVGTITASFGANGLVISPAEYATVNNATSELQSQIDGKQPTLINNSPGTITNVLGYTPPANTQGSITTALGYTPPGNTAGSITTALGYTPPANTAGSITTALGYTPTDLGNSIALGTETTGNADNVSEGATNKYYTDGRVNAAVGSLSVNTLSDVNVNMANENDFLKIVGGQVVAGSSSVTAAFSEVTGSATSTQLPLISGLLGSATSSQLPANAIIAGNQSITIPDGTVAQRPGTPTVGMLRIVHNDINGVPIPASYLASGGSITTPITGTRTTTLECYTSSWVDLGGTGTSSLGSYTVHTFTSSGTFTVTTGTITVEVLTVGGGGGGGNGGGGAGGMRYYNTTLSGTNTVTIGAGGASGTNGNTTSIGTMTVSGGGAGGASGASGVSGGSGGGGGGGAATTGGAGTANEGNDGGVGIAGSPYPAGGGGGKGAVGAAASGSASGAGGIGEQRNISGSNVYYAGGGGGGASDEGATAGAGGSGGGGAGAATGSGGGTNGTVNTGGGGGGAGRQGGNTGGIGGSGIVIIRYPTP